MENVQNYQCPSCGGPLAFDAESSKLKCSYCDSSFDPEDIASQHEDAGGQDGAGTFDGQESAWNTSQLSDEWGQDASTMREYSCPSCGAAIICDETTAATSCPYCDNPTVVETQFIGALRPDYIIPFKLQKKQAVDALKEFYRDKPLLPGSFAEQNHLEEVKGVYVPFWFFDGTAHGSASFHTTKSRTVRQAQSMVRVTEHFTCVREGEISFRLVPVDASRQMDDDLMDSIEPYDYGELKPFSTGFLPGYLANIHDVSVEDCFERANRRCAATCLLALRNTVGGYETCRTAGQSITLKEGTVSYGLLPVYLLNTRFEDTTYTFAINGQTGKIVGNLPSSSAKAAGRFFKRFLTTLVVGTGIAFALMSFMGANIGEMLVSGVSVVSIVSLIVGAVSVSTAKAKMRTVAAASGALQYTDGEANLSVRQDSFQYETKRVIQTARTTVPGNSGMGGRTGFSGGPTFRNRPPGHGRGRW